MSDRPESSAATWWDRRVQIARSRTATYIDVQMFGGAVSIDYGRGIFDSPRWKLSIRWRRPA